MTEEDEAFNEIERQARQRKESVKAQLDKLESQEPVAWRTPKLSNLHRKYGYRDFDDPLIDIFTNKPSPHNEPLYTHPPQRTAQEWFSEVMGSALFDFQEATGCDTAEEFKAQRTEQNFCLRCGKRTKDLTTIHTCTPPQD